MKNRVSFNEFASLYCDSQLATPEGLCDVLNAQRDKFDPQGWFLARCDLLDSSRLGLRVILPFGENNTFKSPPDKPFSPRGLASDTSEVEAVLLVEDLPVSVG